MTEETGLTPEQQAAADAALAAAKAATLGQQVTPPPAQTPPANTPPETPPQTPNQQVATPDGQVTQERFNGAILKIQELTIANRNLESHLQQKNSEIEQLKAELANKDIEKTVAVGERDKNLEAALKDSTAKDNELVELRAFKAKVLMAKELGHPELIGILDNIPSIADQEVLKTVMTEFIRFREDGVREREQVLLSGLTPSVSPIPSTTPKPSTSKSWQDHINSLPFGSPERAKAMDEWGAWEREQEKAKR